MSSALSIGQRPSAINMQLVGTTSEINALPQQRIPLALKIDIGLADFVALQPKVFDGQRKVRHPLMEFTIKIGDKR
ncbi:Uncharacterised protein [Vibrio cholerae]|nr:Uncharacterised protein [Vibrio cholerae]CSA93389.1 Uncharacterised protein [Vibrio cholerae]CSB14020.1 Uncharacterised protein [Vibrio cholerae]CSB17193.1 Uncharacterised protein [Vibrio cholerae]CSB65757.1 Uncharacterised protein [Vibrio cholerae]